MCIFLHLEEYAFISYSYYCMKKDYNRCYHSLFLPQSFYIIVFVAVFGMFGTPAWKYGPISLVSALIYSFWLSISTFSFLWCVPHILSVFRWLFLCHSRRYVFSYKVKINPHLLRDVCGPFAVTFMSNYFSTNLLSMGVVISSASLYLSTNFRKCAADLWSFLYCSCSTL